MWGFYCIAFIEYMLAGKTLLDNINLFLPNDFKNNDKIIYKYSREIITKENTGFEFRLKKYMKQEIIS